MTARTAVPRSGRVTLIKATQSSPYPKCRATTISNPRTSVEIKLLVDEIKAIQPFQNSVENACRKAQRDGRTHHQEQHPCSRQEIMRIRNRDSRKPLNTRVAAIAATPITV